jgi:hypothetical protein
MFLHPFVLMKYVSNPRMTKILRCGWLVPSVSSFCHDEMFLLSSCFIFLFS